MFIIDYRTRAQCQNYLFLKILGDILPFLGLHFFKTFFLNVRTMYAQGQDYVFFGALNVRTIYSQGQNYVFYRKICGKSLTKSSNQCQNYVLLKVRAMYFRAFLNVRTMYLNF